MLQLRVGCGAAGRLGVVLLRKTTVAVAFASVWVVLGLLLVVERGERPTDSDCDCDCDSDSGSHGALASCQELCGCPFFMPPFFWAKVPKIETRN